MSRHLKRPGFSSEITSPDRTRQPLEAYDLLVVTTTGIERFRLPKTGEVIIGRSEECTVQLNDTNVSRRHAMLTLGFGNPLVEDLGSRNGTHVNDRRLASGEQIELNRQEAVRLGSTVMLLQHSTPEGVATETALQVDGAGGSIQPVVERVAQGNINVLILGETGVGKEVMAETIHRLSRRANKPLLRINCAAFTETLLESELLGYERGAFTGAVRSKQGLLETANGGTVFLDELGEMPLSIQAKLLRVIEERKVRRLGALSDHSIDVRFIAATNRPLQEDVDEGKFRRDLFFRLNGISLPIAPLRERVSEIPGLARQFVAKACTEMSRHQLTIATEAITLLQQYNWPGNIRELRNVMERAVLLCTGECITPEDLESPIQQHAARQAIVQRGYDDDESTSLVRLAKLDQKEERQAILKALEDCAGNQTRAAKVLGMSRRTLIYRLAEYAIPRPRK